MIPGRTNRRDFLSTSALGGFVAVTLNDHAWGTTSTQQTPSPFFASGSRYAAATAHPLASQAAMDCFERGGNAIDAAVAASLMLSVVDGHNSGLGGGGLCLIRNSSGQVVALDGRETAPSRIDSSHFLNAAGVHDSQISQEGHRAVAVPGLVALLEQLSNEYGKLEWKPSLQRAAETAERGHPISGYFARVLQASASQLRKFPSSVAVLLDATGQPWQEGDYLRQTDLANSLRMIAQHGSDWFYQGEFAERVEKCMLDGGGLLRADDLASYQIAMREPIATSYRGYQVVGFPPPSSGGIHVAQMLGMLEQYDLSGIFQSSPSTVYHLLLEVMKRAMADRVHWLGDADFANVPRGLIDKDYLRQRSDGIDLHRATSVSGQGVPPNADIDLFGRGGHTTHLTTADSEGNVVALTQTINTSFGCKMIVPGTGIVLNNEMDDFSLAPGVRNAFGLLGSEANKIVAGKRPLSSMSPTIISNSEGKPVLSVGAAGGPRIITAVVQTIIRYLDLKMPLDEALSAPRLHHQWSPDRAVVETSMPESVTEELEKMGHAIQRVDTLAVAQAVSLGAQQLSSASDPRVPSSARAI